MAKTQEQLKSEIQALKDAGMDSVAEEVALRLLVIAEAGKAPVKAVTPAPTPPADNDEEDFVALNTESYETGGGGGWLSPKSIGAMDAICAGFITPDFVEDQLWFIFKNPEYPGGDNPFYGSLVCGGVSRGEKSGAWKIKDVVAKLGIQGAVEVIPGKGIKGLKACEGRPCQVLWDDIVLKGKTERRIQDVMAAGSEAAM